MEDQQIAQESSIPRGTIQQATEWRMASLLRLVDVGMRFGRLGRRRKERKPAPAFLHHGSADVHWRELSLTLTSTDDLISFPD